MKSILQGTASLLAFLLLWDGLSRSGWVPQPLFPPPLAVARALAEWARSGELWRDVSSSLWRAVAGLAIGLTAGVLVGVLTGRVTFLRNVFLPIINLFRPIPPVAIIPLVIVWAGIGNWSKVLATAFAVFFPMFTGTYQGALSIPDSYLWAAQAAGLSRPAILARIVLPTTLTASLAGLRVAVAVAFVMVFVTELAGSSQGLGYQISLAQLNYRIDRMMAALAVLAACAALTDLILVRGIVLVCPWMKGGRANP